MCKQKIMYHLKNQEELRRNVMVAFELRLEKPLAARGPVSCCLSSAERGVLRVCLEQGRGT